MYKVIIKSRADKQFARLSQGSKQKIYEGLNRLSDDPLHHPSVKKIRDTQFGYRLRVGRWRVLFALFHREKKIEVVDIFLKKGREDYAKRKRLLR